MLLSISKAIPMIDNTRVGVNVPESGTGGSVDSAVSVDVATGVAIPVAVEVDLGVGV